MLKKVTLSLAIVGLVLVAGIVAGCTNLTSSQSEASPTPVASQASAQATGQPTAALLTTPPTNIQSYSGPFVGSKNSNVYHYPWCYEAKKIKPENLVTFNTVADACAANYRPCEVCKPPACGATPYSTPTPTPTSLIATTTQVWAPPVNNPDTILTPGPSSPIFSGWYVRFVVNAADGTHPCGAANWYIDNYAAGGVWNIIPPGVNGNAGCPQQMGGGAGQLILNAADIAKLSPGYHTLKCDYLGDSKYAPSEWVGSFYVGPMPTPAPTATPTATPTARPTMRAS